MSKVAPFDDGKVEALARILGECGSGTEISRALDSRGLEDNSGLSTKWRRLDRVFRQVQATRGCADPVLAFIQTFLAPARFAGRAEEFENRRRELNVVLALAGIEYLPAGGFRQSDAAQTLDEAERRVQTLSAKLQGRRIHSEVLKYCRRELMQDNFFHAVFEAAKGLAQRIRDTAGIDGDGAALVDKVFSLDRPVLALNSLRTETEQSEHKGFAALLKGCFAGIRNPLAHEPKILWRGEDDAVDYLTLISLLHRKLDACVLVQRGGAA